MFDVTVGKSVTSNIKQGSANYYLTSLCHRSFIFALSRFCIILTKKVGSKIQPCFFQILGVLHSPVLCMKCFWFPIFWLHVCTHTLHSQNNIGRAITMSLDLFMKSWFVAMARQIITGPQLIFVHVILMFIVVKCSCCIVLGFNT